MNRLFLIVCATILFSGAVSAQDRVFTYTYQSNVLNPGQREIEVWTTLRSGREGFYRGLDARLEFEMGIAKNLQTAFYLNTKNVAQEVTEVDGNHTHVSIETESEWSFSNEWKYKLSDAAANAIGSGLYGEITIAPTELELEFKLLFDKKIGRSTHALNLVSEFEFETEVESENGQEEVEQEMETKYEAVYGFSYNLNSNWNVGLEARNINEVYEGEWEYSVLFAGPGFSYAKGPIWINMTVMPQITGLKHPDDSDSGLYLGSQEKLQTRLLFSFVF